MNQPLFDVRHCPYCKHEDHIPSAGRGKLVTCAHCGLSRLHPRASQAASKKLLDKRYTERNVAESPPDLQRFHASNLREIKFLLDAMPTPGSALDVGTADGNFVFSLNESGINTVGIDPYLGCVEAAKSKNLPVHHASFDEASLNDLIPAHSLDLLVLRESIYYMHDLKEFFRLARRLLKQNGYLYIKMHVLNSLYYDISGKECTGRMGNFVSFAATTDIILALLKREGFDVVSQRRIQIDIVSSIWPATPPIIARIANRLLSPVIARLGKEDRIMLLARATDR